MVTSYGVNVGLDDGSNEGWIDGWIDGFMEGLDDKDGTEVGIDDGFIEGHGDKEGSDEGIALNVGTGDIVGLEVGSGIQTSWPRKSLSPPSPVQPSTAS